MFRIFVYLLLISSLDAAGVYLGVPAPQKITLDRVPEIYHRLYGYWRDQYEQTRLLVESSALTRKPYIEVPLFYTYKGSPRVYDLAEHVDPFHKIIFGSPKFTISSLSSLGSLLISDAKHLLLSPSKAILLDAEYLGVQANSKVESRSDFEVFAKGLDADDMAYIEAELNNMELRILNEVRQVDLVLNSTIKSVDALSLEYRNLHFDWPNLGYEPNLNYKVTYAINVINANTYYSYAELNYDLSILENLKQQRENEYQLRLSKSIELQSKINDLTKQIDPLRQKLELLRKKRIDAQVKRDKKDEIIATFKVTLENLYKVWGFEGDAFNRTLENQKIFNERLALDELFSMPLQGENFRSTANFWKRRQVAVQNLQKNIREFERFCEILGKDKGFKCEDLPEYLLENENEFLVRSVKAHYHNLASALDELHYINYEALKLIYEHFKDENKSLFDFLVPKN